MKGSDLSPRLDLAVLGGGVIGLSIALECARHGWKVCVVDRNEVGKESSWAGAGILPAGAIGSVDDPIEQLRQLSDRLHEQWAAWLLDFTQIDTEYRRSGGLYLARSRAERATLRGNRLWWDELGIEYEPLSLKDVLRKYDWIDPELHGAQEAEFYWVARDAKLRNPRHLRALKRACEKLGVHFFERTEIESMSFNQSEIEQISVRSTDDAQASSTLVAQRYCFSTGAWTRPLLEPLGIQIGVYPVRGQMQLYRLDQTPFPFVLNEGHRYLVPREDGRVLVGSCEEEVGFVKGTSEEMMEQLRQWAVSICSGLKSAELESQWSGLRPGSFDAFPYLGTLHPYKNCYLAAGHFRHGLHWSTATAVLMYQHMNREPTDIDLEPFRVQRGNNTSSLR